MGRKAQVKRGAEEKWEIVQEGLRSGNISETCRKHGIAANLWYRWKDEAEQGAKAAFAPILHLAVVQFLKGAVHGNSSTSSFDR